MSSMNFLGLIKRLRAYWNFVEVIRALNTNRSSVIGDKNIFVLALTIEQISILFEQNEHEAIEVC